MACSTRRRVCGLTRSGRFSTLETVPRETRASTATSLTDALRSIGHTPVLPRFIETRGPHDSGDPPGETGLVETNSATPLDGCERGHLLSAVIGVKPFNPLTP